MLKCEEGGVKALINSRMPKWRNFEKAKRELDRESIRTRKEFPPFKPGSYERLKSVQLWEMILEEIKCPLDMSSACQACPYFKDFLEERLVTQVFKVIRDHHHRHHTCVDFTQHFAQDWNEVLQLRLVCKSWRRAVDNVYFDSFQGAWGVNLLQATRPSSSPVFSDGMKLFHTFQLKLNNKVSFEKNQQFILNSPNLMKMVCIEDSPSDQTDGSRGQILKLLHKHQRHIRGLCYESHHNDTPETIYFRLLELVENARNLKALVLVLNTKCFSKLFLEDEDQDHERKLLNSLQKSPFPWISSLQLIKFESHLENDFVVREILRKCPNLQSLQLPARQKVDDELCGILAKLKLQHYSVEKNSRNLNTGQVELLYRVPWTQTLESLVLKTNFQNLNLMELFVAINRFQNLQYLDLDFLVDHQRCGDEDPLRLELPRLRRLRIGYAHPDRCLDYLLPLESLERLEFGTFVPPHLNMCNCERLIQFQGMGMQLEDSNLWNLFPKLETLEILDIFMKNTTVSYNRRGRRNVTKNIRKYDWPRFQWLPC